LISLGLISWVDFLFICVFCSSGWRTDLPTQRQGEIWGPKRQTILGKNERSLLADSVELKKRLGKGGLKSGGGQRDRAQGSNLKSAWRYSYRFWSIKAAGVSRNKYPSALGGYER
jgi:hypothetical protein